MGEPSRRRVTYGQLEHLWELLDKHRDIAMGYNKTSQAREFSRRMWERIALSLNSYGDGAVKDWKAWCKYWNDYKSKLKKLAAATKSSQHKTGGGQSSIKPMTDIEKKFLQILGDDFGAGLPGVRVEPFEEELLNQMVVNTTSPEIHSSPLNSGCSESILARMEVVHYDIQPGPSWSVPTNPTIQQLTPSSPPNQPQNPLCIPTLHTPRRSPRRHQHTSPSLTTPRRSPRRRLLASPHTQLAPVRPPHSQLVPARSPHTQHSTARSPHTQNAPARPPQSQIAPITEHRRRSRREPPMTVEKARRALIAESQKQTHIAEEKLKMFGILIKEIREMKEIIRTRTNYGPARDGE